MTPAGARPGNEVILTKGPAVEAAGILAALREKELLEKYPAEIVEKAKSLCRRRTVIEDAMIAMKTGGVTAMHDATEGGVIGGLYEIANAGDVGMEIDEDKFIVPDEIKMVCEAFALDPTAAIAEGSLLITAEPSSSGKIIGRLEKAGILSSVIGKVTDDTSVRNMSRKNGEIVPLAIPEQDPFWPVFFEGITQL